jgi:hypothetical protein
MTASFFDIVIIIIKWQNLHFPKHIVGYLIQA